MRVKDTQVCHTVSSLGTGENAPRHSQVASVPPGLQLDDSFRCKPLDICYDFSILGDGIVEEICMKKDRWRDEKGANLLLAGGFTLRQGC